MEESEKYGTVVVPNHFFDGEEVVVTMVEGGFFKAKQTQGLFTTRKLAEEAFVARRKEQEYNRLMKAAKEHDKKFQQTRATGQRTVATKKRTEAKRCLDKQLQSPYSQKD